MEDRGVKQEKHNMTQEKSGHAVSGETFRQSGNFWRQHFVLLGTGFR
jgi:hypothetical protein